MNEALILEKLDKLSAEIKTVKADVLQELKKELSSTSQPEQGAVMDGLLRAADTECSPAQLVSQTKILLGNLEELNEMIVGMKVEVELTDELGPVIKQIYPKSIELISDLEGEFQLDEMMILLRKALTNLDAMGEGLDMLKAGVELRDEMVPILRLMYPRVLRFLNSLHEGEFQAEKLGDLLHTVLINIHTLSDLLNMIQPMTEFVKEVGVLMKETDIIHGMNVWLDGLQQSSGLVKLAGTMLTFLKRLNCNEKQIDEICQVVNNLDFTSVQPVGPIGIVKKINDPQVQQALGFMFMMLQAVGSCLHTYQTSKRES